MEDNEADTTAQAGLHLEHERQLLAHKPEELREFYSLSGPARKDYTIQMAEAEATRIKIVRAAEAEGILAIRKAEAEGFRIIGETLAALSNPELVVKVAGLHALQNVAQSLSNGKATKIFVPQSMGDIFTLLGVGKDAGTPAKETDSAPQQPLPG